MHIVERSTPGIVCGTACDLRHNGFHRVQQGTRYVREASRQ